jgi:hypothetical protein
MEHPAGIFHGTNNPIAMQKARPSLWKDRALAPERFSSEVATGSREENASKQKCEARF